jgi:CBS domain-containing protein
MFWRREKTPEDNKREKTNESVKKTKCSLWKGAGQNPCLMVSDVFNLHGCISISINSDSSVEEVIGSFVRKPSLGGIFLVDSKLRFVGLITRTDLLKWAHIKLVGGKGRHEIAVSELFRIADARRAKELMTPDTQILSVKESDTLQAALDKMLDYKQDIIPVVDDEGRILGDLGLSEVLWAGIAYGRQSTRE